MEGTLEPWGHPLRAQGCPRSPQSPIPTFPGSFPESHSFTHSFTYSVFYQVMTVPTLCQALRGRAGDTAVNMSKPLRARSSHFFGETLEMQTSL